MQQTALDLRKGYLVSYQGRMCTVVHWNILKNDRRQFVQMKLKDLKTGRISELKEHTDTKFDVLENSVIDLSHSYRDGNDEVFYTAEGEEHRCAVDSAADALRWKSDVYKGLLVDGHLVSINPPASVVATVVDTAPPIKGVLGGTKDAVLENGLKLKVSMLVANGDQVRVDPETLEFRERV